MQKIRQAFRSVMIGRYGPDHLGFAMSIMSLLLLLLGGITNLWLLTGLSYLLISLAVFRMMSRSIRKRRSENDKYIRYWWPIRTKLLRHISTIKQRRTHRFFRCPSCRKKLRVPRNKGKLQITCPKCGERFFKKT